MTESEAQKILEFLIRRFERHPSTVDVAIKRITKKFNDALIIEYKYTQWNVARILSFLGFSLGM